MLSGGMSSRPKKKTFGAGTERIQELSGPQELSSFLRSEKYHPVHAISGPLDQAQPHAAPPMGVFPEEIAAGAGEVGLSLQHCTKYYKSTRLH